MLTIGKIILHAADIEVVLELVVRSLITSVVEEVIKVALEDEVIAKALLLVLDWSTELDLEGLGVAELEVNSVELGREGSVLELGLSSDEVDDI